MSSQLREISVDCTACEWRKTFNQDRVCEHCRSAVELANILNELDAPAGVGGTEAIPTCPIHGVELDDNDHCEECGPELDERDFEDRDYDRMVDERMGSEL